MPLIAEIVGLMVLLLLMGAGLCCAKHILPDDKAHTQVALALCISGVLFSSVCLGLTAIGTLRWFPLLLLIGGLSLALLWRMGFCRVKKLLSSSILLACTLLFSFQASEHLWGRWDPGIYTAKAFGIMHEGGFGVEDSVTRVLDSDQFSNFYAGHGRTQKYMGVAWHPDKPQDLAPSFYPALSCMMAGVGLLFGPQSMFIVPSLFVGLACISLWTFMAVWWGRAVAWATVVAMVFNPVTLWFSSFPTGEVASLPLILLSLLLWRIQRQQISCCGMALLALSLFMLSLSSVVGLLLAVLCMGLVLYTIPLKEGAKVVLPALLLLGAGQWAQHTVWAPRYGEQLAKYLPHIGSLIPWLIGAALLVATVLYFLRAWIGRDTSCKLSPWFLLILIGGAIAFESLGPLSRLSGMFSNWGCVGILLGCGLWLYRGGREVFLLLLLVSAYALLFLWSPMMSDNFPWAYKRFFPLLVPVACCALGMLVHEAVARGRSVVSGLLLSLFVVSVALPLYHGRYWAFAREWQGTYALLEKVDQALPDGAVLMVPTPYAEPMEFIFERTVFPIYGFEQGGNLEAQTLETIAILKDEGHRVFFLWPRRMRALEPPEISQLGKFRPARAPYKLEQATVPYRGLDRRKQLVVDLRLDEYIGAQKKRLE